MRLLIASNLFHPDRAGGAAIYSDFAYAMVERGHEVTVRCSYPYFPEWRDKTGRNGLAVWRHVDRGVRVEHHGTWYPQGGIRSLEHRLAFEASQLVSLGRTVLSGSFDAVLAFATHPGTTAFASLVATVRRLPLVIDVQDLASDAAGATGLASGGSTAARGLAAVERAVLGRADALTALSPGMVSRVQALVPSRPVVLAPNWLHRSLAELAAVAAAAPRDRRASAGGRVRLLYAGNIGGKQDLLRFCQRLATLEAPFELAIHAAGLGADEIRAWIADVGDERFVVGPFLDEEAFIRALHAADLFVLCERAGSGHSYMPSKLLPAQAVGTPILAVSDADSSLGEEVRTHGLGLALGWEEVDALESLIPALLEGDGRLSAWSAAGQQRSRAFDREAVISQLEDLLIHTGQIRRDRHGR